MTRETPTPKPIPVAYTTPAEALRYLLERYEFPPDLARYLRACLSPTMQVGMRTPPEAFTPEGPVQVHNLMPDRPRFLQSHYPIERMFGGECEVDLGNVHGFGIIIRHFMNSLGHDSNVVLVAGCRRFRTRHSAVFHWSGNRNREGEARPHATDLINYVVAYCAYKGWRWGA